LIVDDHEDNGSVLADALELRGHATRFVPDAATALAEAPAFAPHIAIVDILLPDMNGYELGKKLRSLPGLESVCLLAISGFTRDPENARAAGFHGYVMKPITLDKLEAAIHQCLAIAGGVA
jgi:CheY-like chemotaxis protein